MRRACPAPRLMQSSASPCSATGIPVLPVNAPGPGDNRGNLLQLTSQMAKPFDVSRDFVRVRLTDADVRPEGFGALPAAGGVLSAGDAASNASFAAAAASGREAPTILAAGGLLPTGHAAANTSLAAASASGTSRSSTYGSAAWLTAALHRAHPHEGLVMAVVVGCLAFCVLGASFLLLAASRSEAAEPERWSEWPRSESFAQSTLPEERGPTDKASQGTTDRNSFIDRMVLGTGSYLGSAVSSTTSLAVPSRHLCPGLVVPARSECYLAVRTAVTAHTRQVEFEVLDLAGKPVLRVEVTPHMQTSRPWPAQLLRSPTVVLKTLSSTQDTPASTLAYCCSVAKEEDSAQGGHRRNVYIYRADDELFAHLMKDEARNRYVMTSGRLGLQLLFDGVFSEHCVSVTNEKNDLLAATEPHPMEFDLDNKYYKLRVASSVDVGLVLCGLLAIDQIEVT